MSELEQIARTAPTHSRPSLAGLSAERSSARANLVRRSRSPHRGGGTEPAGWYVDHPYATVDVGVN